MKTCYYVDIRANICEVSKEGELVNEQMFKRIKINKSEIKVIKGLFKDAKRSVYVH